MLGFIKQVEVGMAAAEQSRQHGFSPTKFYQCRAKYGGMEAGDVQRLKALEIESGRLKMLLAEAYLDVEVLKVGSGANR